MHLQPWRWTPDQQAWTLAADAFPEPLRQDVWWVYPLPGTGIAKQLTAAAKPNSAQPPKGWSVSTVDDLHKHLTPLEEEVAVKFFDGAVPHWQTALSASIPRRQIVGRLMEHFHDADTVNRPIVSLLLAAGCEGKTTAMLQTAYEIVRNSAEWRILRRVDDAEPLIPALILPVLTKPYRWLVLLDEADRTAEALFNFLRQMPRDLQGRLHFLVACRDSDWQASEAYNLNWLSVCTFYQDTLAGLGNEEAQKIVTAWGNFGKRGLGDLCDVPEGERAKVLDQKAREESKTSHGAFFGALLSVRHGTDLPNHARLMLERLNQRSISSGGTLRDALAYVAIMHSEGLEFLSRTVLAQALACPLAKLHREVLAPLGQEAAATATSSFVFTRHRRIAETVVSILENDLADDIAERYAELGMAAIDAYGHGDHVPDLAAWRFRMPEHFFDSGRKSLAIDFARAVLSREPQNIITLVSVAKLYRRAGLSEDALKLFQSLPKSVQVDRAFVTEWAVSEADCGDFASSALLAAFALSDDCHRSRVDTDNGIICLSVVNKALRGLFTGYRETIFLEARAAAAVLALQLNLNAADKIRFRRDVDEAKADGCHTPSVEKSFELFVSVTRSAS